MIPIKPMEFSRLENLARECKGHKGSHAQGDLCFYVGTKEKFCDSQKLISRAGIEKDINVYACGEKYKSPNNKYPDICGDIK